MIPVSLDPNIELLLSFSLEKSVAYQIINVYVYNRILKNSSLTKHQVNTVSYRLFLQRKPTNCHCDNAPKQ